MKYMAFGMLLSAFFPVLGLADSIQKTDDGFVLMGDAGGATEDLYRALDKACDTGANSICRRPETHKMEFGAVSPIITAEHLDSKPFRISFDTFGKNNLSADGKDVLITDKYIPSLLTELLIDGGAHALTESVGYLLSVKTSYGTRCSGDGRKGEQFNCRMPNTSLLP